MITMRFIRKMRSGQADPDPQNDDQLQVIKLGENSVRAIYTEMQAGDAMVDISIMNYIQLNVYIYRIFWLLGIDDDPFKSVQIFVPGYPSILIEVAKLQQFVPHLMDMLAHTYVAWPSRGSYVRQHVVPPTVSTATFSTAVAARTAPSVNETAATAATAATVAAAVGSLAGFIAVPQQSSNRPDSQESTNRVSSAPNPSGL
jgi:hypothetical protein